MTTARQSGNRQPSPAAFRVLYERFADEISADNRTSSQLAAWSDARSHWRTQWISRTELSAELVFQRLVPSPTSSGPDFWVHPVADGAVELDSWRARWRDATSAERNELAATCERVITLIESDVTAAADACAMLAGSACGQGMPLAALTPALSSLAPSRFVVLCDAWLRTLGQYEGAELPKGVGAYPELNAVALRWLAIAEGHAIAPVFAGCPPADRWGVFFAWVVRTNPGATGSSRFDVTQKKYKEWPPMW